ncbi:phospho-sugar mutase [Mesoaciditoga lauensis]|uniref:phospho-sugar mutase n=1 Tax=Mesoaciditoga lauensis TaxID=1495039 RepID=UPI00056D8E05|nr:phospho-sugar mutase [Mesoaciditoga lauensis]
MEKNAEERYKRWLADPSISEEDKKKLRSEDDAKLQDAFYKELEFGTGGMRGVMGLGDNRMNVYTVGRASQAFANYINKSVKGEKSAVISYDTRHMSKEFAQETAEIFAANGIKAYLFEEFRPTPILSFAVRHLRATAGVMITASHNLPKYNGYKAYWSNGAQVIPPHDEGIIREYKAIKSFGEIKRISLEEAKKKDLVVMVSKEIDEAYFEKALSLSFKSVDPSLKIVYTPLHGTGGKIVPVLLEKDGFHPYIQKEQGVPNGDFPTVEYPNPEDPKAFKLSLEDAKRLNADIIAASDPDADRMGIMVRHNGEFVRIDGNQMGVLLLNFIAEKYSEKGMPSNPTAIESIVSSKMFAKVARSFDVDVVEVLTGFKWICNVADKLREAGKSVIFSYEESYGYNIGDFVYDKDSATAIMLTCEMASEYKKKGMTLVDALESLYKKYGYYFETQIAPVFEGEEGMSKIKAIVEALRKTPPSTLAGYTLTKVTDYINGVGDIPPSNVLKFEFGKNLMFYCRPSGTEPKVKFYIMAMEFGEKEQAMSTLNKAKEEILHLVEEFSR